MRRLFRIWLLLLTCIIIAGTVGISRVFGQGGTPPPGSLFPLICSATDYTTVAATALGISAPEVRLALAKGQTLQDLATSKSVDFQKVADAISEARKADIALAVKDGLLTEAEASLMTSSGTPLGDSSDNPAINITTGAGSFPYGVADHNLVNPFLVVAQTLSMSCPDLYKEVQAAKSVVRIAQGKSVKIGQVIDGLLKAYTDALAQDVKDTLITQQQADDKVVPMTESVLVMVGNPNGMLAGGPGGRIVPALPPIPSGGGKLPKATPTPAT